jgi:hypothetical protein
MSGERWCAWLSVKVDCAIRCGGVAEGLRQKVGLCRAARSEPSVTGSCRCIKEGIEFDGAGVSGLRTRVRAKISGSLFSPVDATHPHSNAGETNFL